MDREAWNAAVHGVKKSDMTELLNWTELNSLDVFPTFFNWSLNFAIKDSWSEPQSAPSLVFDDYLELFHLSLKRNNQSDFSIGHLVMSICRVFFCVVGRGCLLWPVHLLTNLCYPLPCFILYSKAKFVCTPGISWLPSFAFQSPMMKRTCFLRVLEGLIGLHRIIQLQLLHSYWLQYRLGSPWYWMVHLGNKERSFCHFRDCTQVLHFGFFCWLWGLLHFF